VERPRKQEKRRKKVDENEDELVGVEDSYRAKLLAKLSSLG
jgi:hypothetical protein